MSDWDDLDSDALLQARRDLRRDMERQITKHPDAEASIRQEYAGELAQIDALVSERIEMFDSHARILERIAEDGPLAPQLFLTLAQQEDEQGMYEVMRDLASRFTQQPAPEPEPELSDLVADVLPNNAWSGFRDMQRAATAAADPFAPSKVVNRETHFEPLGRVGPSGWRPNDDDEVSPQEEVKASMRREGILKPFTRRDTR